MTGIAMQHADDGYSRLENFGGSLLYSMFSIIYSCTNAYCWKGGEFEARNAGG